MKISAYEPSMSSDLANAYNYAVRAVPHCYTVPAGEMADAMAPATGKGRSHKRLHSEEAFVAIEGDAILGFVHTALERPKEAAGEEKGAIRFFWYGRGHRKVGQELLNVAEDCLTGSGLGEITAFWQDYRYPFHGFGHSYMSDRLGQVHGLMGINGSEIALEWVKGKGARPGIVVKALQDDKEIGTCKCISCAEFSSADEAQDWFFTEWLNVVEDLQGRGLGRYLLQYALKEMHAIGYRHAAISTDWHNHRGLLFYSNVGYHVVDWTYCLARKMQP
jgi:GNAT superfamily N-acetyltransferase